MALIVLICIPFAILFLPTGFFVDRIKTASSQDIQPLFVVLALIIVPIMLWAFSKSSDSAFVLGFVFSGLSAVWFFWCLKKPLILLALALIIASLTFDPLVSVVSLAAGLGAAQLIASRMKHLMFFALAFCVLDCVMVFSGLVDAATSQMPLIGGFAVGDLPLYNHLSIGGYVLGAGDIFFAGIVAFLVQSRRKSSATVFLIAQAFLLVLASSEGWSVPATIPGAITLIWFLASCRWHRQLPESLVLEPR